MLKTILAISGKPGLFKLISRGRGNLIVETLDKEKKRMPAFASDKVVSLADISIYADSGDIPLKQVLTNISKKENGQPVSINPKKASREDLEKFFAEILPDYDRDRVHLSDIKKLISWYNTLISQGITEFNDALKPTEGDNIADRKE